MHAKKSFQIRVAAARDLTDDEWALIEPLIPPARRGRQPNCPSSRARARGVGDLQRGAGPLRS